MKYTLENNKAILVVDSMAAEIHSFKLKSDGIERMWQGDPEFWKGRNPTLFPQVGNTYNKTQVFKGKEYHMGNHGIARHNEFELEDKTDNSITLLLKASDKTMEEYPFDFALHIKYTLTDSKVEIAYTIDNNDEAVMPFGFGLHPAFNCPLNEGEDFEDYYIEFSSFEDASTAERELIKDHKLYMKHEYFEKFNTIIYKDLNSAFVTLSNGKHHLKVTCSGYPYLAFWHSKKDAKFVCIEPWYSHGDFEEIHLPFEERIGIINLESKKSFVTTYEIEIID